MLKDQRYWLHKLSTLRIDRAHGNPAPHKPLLLLVIIEMMDKGEITNREVALSPDLAFRFSIFWSIVAQRRKQAPEVRLPFHHLGSSGIWQPLTVDGAPSPDKKLTAAIRLDPTFFDCLADQRFRDQAQRVLIETEPYFRPEERAALYSMLKIRPTTPEIHDNKELFKASVQTGRDARFRIEVVVLAYKHTCALTGYRITTLEMESIVDAAHIQEFRDSRNNDPRNGIALTKNAHWQFDRGLWSLNDNYKVLVNREKFIEEGVPGQRLADFEGRRIFLPGDPKYWPEYNYLDWHRRHHGFSN
ncbi:MAG: HNH endonuclease [Deltaproteobacteria bacterium]|nr:HNH endonuclease [Deltaproteobacteria bacterium]